MTEHHRVGELAGRGEELTRRARALMVSTGYSDDHATRFLGQMKRRHGEVIVLTSISDYLELQPTHVISGEPLDAKQWIYWRIRELVGRPVPGVRRLVPGPSMDDKAGAPTVKWRNR